MKTTTASTITGIATIGVPVRNQDLALAFFTGTLGFETRTDYRGDGFRWLTVAPQGSPVTIALVHKPDDTGRDTGVRFIVENAENEHERLVSLGVDVGNILHWPGVPAMFDFRDRDGNLYEMVEAK